MRNEGYQLLEADDGHEALMAVLKTVPDLIVTDLNMRKGGIDYVKRLHASCPACPTILMTAFGDPRTKDEALRSGATVYFAKPVRMSDLKNTIAELVRTRAAKRSKQSGVC